MKPILFDMSALFLADPVMQSMHARLVPEITRVSGAWGNGYSTPYAFLSLPGDTAMHKKVSVLVEQKRLLKPEIMVVIV